MKTATITFFLDKRRGESILKLRVTFARTQRLYSTGLKIDEKTFERIKANAFKSSPDGKIKDPEFLSVWKLLFDRDDQKPGYAVFAQSITERLGANFTFDRFKELLDTYGKEPEAAPADTTDLLLALSKKGESMIGQGRVGNGINYGLAGKSLKRFIESLTDEERREFGLPVVSKHSRKQNTIPLPLLTYSQLTSSLLKLYEQWMTTDQGLTSTTVGIYCRHIRAVFNDAISNGLVSQDVYPFGKGRYVIPAGKNPKKALSKDDVMKIIRYQPEEGFEQRAKDFWVFSYLSNGMNITDILNLRWENIDLKTDKLTFIRQKTARSTKGNQRVIQVMLTNESKAIIERWANPDKSPKTFVFNILSENMDASRKKTVSNQFIKMTNKYIRGIAKKLGIQSDVTTYGARHSFATILLRSEVPLAFISQSLGHINIATTESYLGSFDDDKTKSYLKALTD